MAAPSCEAMRVLFFVLRLTYFDIMFAPRCPGRTIEPEVASLVISEGCHTEKRPGGSAGRDRPKGGLCEQQEQREEPR